ncbi:hypothetical protein Tco_0208046, partial [Tanacetum coccineum]
MATNEETNAAGTDTRPPMLVEDNVDYQLSQEMHQEEHLDSDAETEID